MGAPGQDIFRRDVSCQTREAPFGGGSFGGGGLSLPCPKSSPELTRRTRMLASHFKATRVSEFITSAVLRLECSIDCISGSVGHQQNFSVHFLTVSVSVEEEQISTKFNWVSGSQPMLYKLVISPIPIVHTNFQENPLTTLGISRHLKII